MLEFSKVLAEVVLPRRELQHYEKKTVISGVYVPALHHLRREYKIPTRLDNLQQNARWLAICGGYVEAARLGYPDGFWWRTLLSVSSGLGAGPSLGVVAVRDSGHVHDCKFVLVKDGKSCDVIACDQVLSNEEWLRGATESAAELLDTHKLTSAVLIGRNGEENVPDFLLGKRVALVVDQNSNRAARKAIAALKGEE
jgi:hypothetical protein